MYLSVLTRHSLYFYYGCWRLPCFPKCQYFCKCQYIFYFYLSLRRYALYASWYLAISDFLKKCPLALVNFGANCIFPFWPAILFIYITEFCVQKCRYFCICIFICHSEGMHLVNEELVIHQKDQSRERYMGSTSKPYVSSPFDQPFS